MQKYSDDTAIVACNRSGQQQKYRSLIEALGKWRSRSSLHLKTWKPKIDLSIYLPGNKRPTQRLYTKYKQA